MQINNLTSKNIIDDPAGAIVSEGSSRNIPENFKAGMEITGIVSMGENDEVRVDFEGYKITGKKSDLKGAEAGQLRRFRIMDISSKGVTLKDLGPVESQSSGKVQFTRVDSNLTSLVEGFRETQGLDTEDDDSTDGIRLLSGEDVSELKQERYSIEDFRAEELGLVIERVKEGLALKKGFAEEGHENLEREHVEASITAVKNALSSGNITPYILSLLDQLDLPHDAAIVSDVRQTAAQAVDSLSALAGSDSAKAYLLKNGLQPTIMNMYKAVHAGQLKRKPLTEAEWSELKPQALELLKSSENADNPDYSAEKQAGGQPGDRQSAELARMLIEYDIPVNVENVSKLNSINSLTAELTKNTAAELKIGYVRLAVNSLADGRQAADTVPDLEESRKIYAADQETSLALNTIDRMDNGALHRAVESMKSEDLSLKDISGHITTKSTTELTTRELKFRVDIETIRLRLSAASGQMLYAKGIKVYSDSVTRVAEGLRELEREYYDKLMQETGETASAGDSELAARIDRGMESLALSPVSTLAVTYSVRSSITLNTLMETGESQRSAAMRMGETYEAVGTQVRRDLGDSINKAFGNIDELLKENELELTEINRRAVRILGRNGMEITEESITEIKYYDTKVNSLIENMQPAVTAALIRKGINPLDYTVDELNAEIQKLKEAPDSRFNEDRYQDYADFLLNMEKSGISAQERDAYIGIYRLLHTIEKNDGAAIGALLNSGRKLTLGNLLTEARTGNGRHIDVDIDDDTGISRRSYINSITAQILNITDSAAWTQVNAERLEEMSLEQVKETLENADIEGEAEAWAVRTQQIRETLTANTSESSFLRAFDIPDSVNNITALESLLESSLIPVNREDESNERDMVTVPELPETEQELKALIGSGAEADRIALSEEIFVRNSSAEVRDLTQAVNRLRLTGVLAEKRHYSFALSDEQGAEKAIINLTVIGGRTGSTAGITLTGENYSLRAEIKVSGETGSINGLITLEGEGSFEASEAEFRGAAAALGYEDITLSTAKVTKAPANYISRLGELKKAAAVNSTDGETAVSQIYTVAKAFIEAYAR